MKDGVRIGVGILLVFIVFGTGITLLFARWKQRQLETKARFALQTQGRRIIYDARCMDAAIDQWVIEKGKKDGDAITTSEAALYLRMPWPDNDVLGNAYTIGNVGSNQVKIAGATKTVLDGVGIYWSPY